LLNYATVASPQKYSSITVILLCFIWDLGRTSVSQTEEVGLLLTLKLSSHLRRFSSTVWSRVIVEHFVTNVFVKSTLI
jgi:hypothetical protein